MKSSATSHSNNAGALDFEVYESLAIPYVTIQA